MQILYYKDKIPEKINKSLFLAGCSLRPNQEGESWRKDALQILTDIGFDGTVFVPENENGKFDEDHNYAETVEWEEKHLNVADAIIFWMPRNLDKEILGLTSNYELGRWENSGKVFLGYPEGADKMNYLQYYADKLNIKSSNSLTETIQNALEFIGDGVERAGGERFVPLYIWNTPQFQSWYKAQTNAGNRLDNARVLYNFRPQNKTFVFAYVLQVDVFIASENRNKTNEIVIARTDISSVLMWQKKEPILNSEVVLVREFRSPASTEEDNQLEIAAEEVFEETGLHIQADRMKFHSAKQLAGTFSLHKSHLFSVELIDEEMEWLKAQKDVPHGNIKDSERTFIEVYTIQELLDNNLLDWSNLGMILSLTFVK